MEGMFEKPLESELERVGKENLELKKKISELEKENLELKEKISELVKKAVFSDLAGAFRRNFFQEKLQKDIDQLLGEEERREQGYKEISILFCDSGQA